MTPDRLQSRPSTAPRSNITFGFERALGQFVTHLEARLLAEQTVVDYRQAVISYSQFHAALGLPDDVTTPTREHIELWVADLAGRTSPATVINRFKGLRAFFKWLLTEGEIREHPMARMDWPKVPEKIIPALDAAKIQAMPIPSCQARTSLVLHPQGVKTGLTM